MAEAARRVLLVTLPPQIVGGVATKARYLAAHLERRGFQVSWAYYAARSLRPDLNPGWLASLAGVDGRLDAATGDDGREHRVVGCRFSGYEPAYTADSPVWRAAIAPYTRTIAVGGTPMIAHPLAAAGVPHLLWCADDVDGDREARRRALPTARRWIDAALVEPRLAAQQAVVLARTPAIRGVSGYTVGRLARHAEADPARLGRLPIPVDDAFFSPPDGFRSSARIGFAGRLADPRKNAPLLFDAFARLLARRPDAELAVAGPRDAALEAEMGRAAMGARVRFLGVLDPEALRNFLRGLDVFVLPSTREGLAVAGLEAMACGVPVVSTRSGGPEDYVVDGETGYLANFDADDLATRILAVMDDGERRAAMARACRATVVDAFSDAAFGRHLDDAWRAVWDEPCAPA
ncbi:MAG: glycosyltransferase family 4 protein [Rhodospirillaceae bacterium]